MRNRLVIGFSVLAVVATACGGSKSTGSTGGTASPGGGAGGGGAGSGGGNGGSGRDAGSDQLDQGARYKDTDGKEKNFDYDNNLYTAQAAPFAEFETLAGNLGMEASRASQP